MLETLPWIEKRSFARTIYMKTMIQSTDMTVYGKHEGSGEELVGEKKKTWAFTAIRFLR